MPSTDLERKFDELRARTEALGQRINELVESISTLKARVRQHDLDPASGTFGVVDVGGEDALERVDGLLPRQPGPHERRYLRGSGVDGAAAPDASGAEAE